MSELIESLFWDKLEELQALSQKANETSLAYKERRKQLTRNTREFKALTDDEKLSQLPKLLLQYQNELDQLTKDNREVTLSVKEILSSLEKIIEPSEPSSDNPYIICPARHLLCEHLTRAHAGHRGATEVKEGTLENIGVHCGC